MFTDSLDSAVCHCSPNAFRYSSSQTSRNRQNQWILSCDLILFPFTYSPVLVSDVQFNLFHIHCSVDCLHLHPHHFLLDISWLFWIGIPWIRSGLLPKRHKSSRHSGSFHLHGWVEIPSDSPRCYGSLVFWWSGEQEVGNGSEHEPFVSAVCGSLPNYSLRDSSELSDVESESYEISQEGAEGYVGSGWAKGSKDKSEMLQNAVLGVFLAVAPLLQIANAFKDPEEDTITATMLTNAVFVAAPIPFSLTILFQNTSYRQFILSKFKKPVRVNSQIQIVPMEVSAIRQRSQMHSFVTWLQKIIMLVWFHRRQAKNKKSVRRE